MIVGKLVRRLLASVAGWMVIAPIGLLVPKRRDWVAVVGRQDGRFLDNSKYFFLQAPTVAPELRIVFITERRDVEALIRDGHREVLLYPSIRVAWFLARCGTVVVDEAAWFRNFRFFLLIRARAIQLWHGIPFKWIEGGLWRHESGRSNWASHPMALRLRLLVYRITGRHMRYAAVATTSRFYRDAVFASAFLARRLPVTGYPRNDFAKSLEGASRELAWSNVDARVKAMLPEWQRLGRRVVLIAPTFRDSGSLPVQLDKATLRAVDKFSEVNGVEILFKFHPSERNVDHIAGRHFHVCARDTDIYPVMPYLSALVTDYSSISMDFLLVDRPVLFLIPDDDDYACNDRQLQFDPRTMMPGPVVPDWPSLLASLLAQWANDAHSEERAALRRRAFDDLPQVEAVPRLLAFMREQGWVSDPPTTAGNCKGPGDVQPPTQMP